MPDKKQTKKALPPLTEKPGMPTGRILLAVNSLPPRPPEANRPILCSHTPRKKET